MLKFNLQGLKATANGLEEATYTKLSDLADTAKVLLYFYPKDNTPGCTNEANDFNRLQTEFAKQDITVIGCSPDSIASHEKFITKYDLKFLLLSDPEKTLIKEMGAWGEKKNYGRVYEGLIRSTFLIDVESGEVLEEWKNVRAKGHGDRVCKLLTDSE